MEDVYSNETPSQNVSSEVKQIDLELAEMIKKQAAKIKVIGIPGHSKGSICFLLDLPEGKILFTGDAVFVNGQILVLNCDGSELSDYRRYINRLSNLNIDILFPGHGLFALSEGQKHLDMAIESLRFLFTPGNYV